MKPQQRQYFRSLADELHAQEQRVRNLIGSKHWLTDGHHKEALLRGLLERHCPPSVAVRHGFIVSEDGGDTCSREQDILILDTFAEMPLFSFHGSVVAPSRLALATVAVKSKFSPEQLRDALDCVRSIPLPPLSDSAPWAGVFFYQADDRNVQSLSDTVLKAMSPENGSGAPELAPLVVRVGADMLAVASLGDGELRVRAYMCDGLSTAYFVARLLDLVARRRGAHSTAFADALDANDEALQVAEAALPWPRQY